MIEKMTPKEIDSVADIWLEGNLDAHNFINARYWKRSFPTVKSQLNNTEVYVYKENQEIAGFVGLNGNYIEGVFVKKEFRSKGIGKELFDYIKQLHEDLIISCYVKNFKAINFYRVNGFSIKAEGIDKDTGESEITLIWRKNG